MVSVFFPSDTRNLCIDVYIHSYMYLHLLLIMMHRCRNNVLGRGACYDNIVQDKITSRSQIQYHLKINLSSLHARLAALCTPKLDSILCKHCNNFPFCVYAHIMCNTLLHSASTYLSLCILNIIILLITIPGSYDYLHVHVHIQEV